MRNIILNGTNLCYKELEKLLDDIVNSRISLDEKQLLDVEKSNSFLINETKNNKVIYGVNTGVGLLSDTLIAPDEQLQLQKNLVRSHCVSPAEYLSFEDSKVVLLLLINSLLKGLSGVSKELLLFLTELYNKNIIPAIPKLGSVGASGDLAPLASIGLAVIGEGDIYTSPSSQPIKCHNIPEFKGYSLQVKEGLSLMNGLHQSLAILIINFKMAKKLFNSAGIVSALSLEGLRGSYQPFSKFVGLARPTLGIYKTINFFAQILKESEINKSHKLCGKVQDPYSFRCIPQVFGAIEKNILYVEDIIDEELLSCTDNPIIDYKNKQIIFAGNFHGQDISFAGDILAISISTLSNMSERRIEKLLDDKYTRLSPFLTRKEGLHSGLMMLQVVATDLCVHNKTLATPVSINTIPTSLGKEDFISFSNLSVQRLEEMLINFSKILAIETICACEALELLKPLKPAKPLQKLYDRIRTIVPPINQDRPLRDEIITLSKEILKGEIIKHCDL